MERCIDLFCCCQRVNNTSERRIKNQFDRSVLTIHKFCGCKESRKQFGKMKKCDDRKLLVDEEVVEALDYDYIDTEETSGECLIEDPAVPFTHELQSALHPQFDIVIQGLIKENATRFAVNLIMGRSDDSDIAFHFNPRLDQLYSARNSRFEGCWGYEEGNSQQSFPFQRNQHFHLQLFLTHSEFLVAVNGTHYCAYTYRTSLLNITTLQVEGGVKLSRVHLHSALQYPSPLPPDCSPCPYKFPLQNNSCAKTKTQITPVYGLLQEKLKNESVIEINGRVKLLPFSFFVNLQESSGIWPHPEIPLHISVRFSQGGDHVILANAWLQKGWGQEEITHTKCLFTPGYPFTLRITCSEDAYVAVVDDQPLLVFKHRVPFCNINTLHIQGDVYIYDVKLS